MFLALILLVASLVSAQEVIPRPPARTLEVANERSLGAPVFPFYDLIQSDKEGNLYFHASPSANDATILKIGTDGSPIIFRPPNELPKDAYFRRFYVTRSGQLYTLIAAANGAEFYCVSYRSSGSARSPLKLPIDGQASETEFAVFENGNIVVGGFFRTTEENKGKRFRYLLDKNGELLRKLENTEENVDLGKVFSQLLPGGIAEADDGNLYMVVGAGGGRFNVTAIGSDGTVSRKTSFNVPEADFVPLQVFVDSGQLVAVSHKRRKSSVNAVEILAIELATGEHIGRYVPPEQAGNMLVHFSLREGFKFLKAKNGVLWTLSAQVR